MHLGIILLALGLALLVRLRWSSSKGLWTDRLQSALVAFLFPPLLLTTTSLVVVGMGHHGTMLWQPVGWLGCHIALGLLAFSGMVLGLRLWQNWKLTRQVCSCTCISIAGRTGRLLETPALVAAQVGIWQPQLLISRGLLQSLETEQIEAVLSHEEAHAYYRDTFWFFWFAWICRFTAWLPKTEALWQELLLLRELRADAWAAQRVDALTLAETLVQVVQSYPAMPHYACAAFHEATSLTRLEERIESLLAPQDIKESQGQLWIWLLAISLPLLTLPLHV